VIKASTADPRPNCHPPGPGASGHGPRTSGWLSTGAALAILAVGLAAAILGGWRIRGQQERVAGIQVEHEFERVQTAFKARFQKCLDGLNAARGLFNASHSVERDEFRAFATDCRMPADYPGAVGFGFIQRVSPAVVDDFIAAQRADGAPDFAVKTAGAPSDLYVVKFIEPLSGNRALLGTDIGADAEVRRAAERAMLTGEAELTARRELLRDERSQPSVLFLLPVFDRLARPSTPEERRRDLIGWVFAPLVIDETVSGISTAADGFLDLEIYAGREMTSRTLIYDYHRDPHGWPNSTRFAGMFKRRASLEICGKEWTLWMGSLPAFDLAYSDASAVLVGTVGSLASILLALLVWELGLSRRRALGLAEAMTSDLRSSEASAHENLATLEAYQAALNRSVIIAVTDVSGTITEANDAFCSISGYSREELIGANHRIVNSGHHPRSFWVEMWKTVAKAGLWRAEVCNRAKNGTLYWVDTTIGPIRAAGGKLRGYISVRFDITQRKLTEQNLRRSSLIQDEMSLAAHVGGWELETATGKVTWTREIHRIFELPEDFTPTLDNSLSFYPPESRAIVAQHLEEASTSGTPFDYTVPFTTAKGRALWVRGRGKAVRGEDGGTRLYGVFQDVTTEHQRSADLEGALDAAHAASRIKDQFLANMSHEFRTPMNGIIGMSELALDTDLSAEQRSYLETVVECASSLLAIVNDVLDLSKIEAGKLDLAASDFDLVACVEGALSVLAPRATAKEIELVCNIASGVPRRACGDAGRLRQVLTNLVGNAVKFTDHGEVELAVLLQGLSDEAATLSFSVRDTGMGISPEHQQSIFERFTQVDGTSSRKHGGTGLGLTISRQIVEAMGGDLRVESELGLGSTFSFSVRLPCSKADGHTRAEPGDPQSSALHTLRGKRVLVVDDNATNRRILEARLRDRGCSVTKASDGPSALERMRLAREESPGFDLVLLDIHMPGMDGYEVARAIRTDPPRYGTPFIVVLSSVEHARDPQAHAHCDAYLRKPVRQADLAGVVSRLFALDVQTASAERVPERSPSDGARRLGGRVLVVEDNLVNTRLALGLLRKFGCEATLAENGARALERLEHETFELVLMDLHMPVMGGLEATRRIRERERTLGTHVPIVAMTARAMKEDERECLEAGMDDYLAKPIRAADARRVLETWIRAPRSGSGNRDAVAGVPGPAHGTLDMEEALVRLEGDRQLLDQALDAFRQAAPETLSSLRAAASRADAPALAAAAHGLKGAAAALCAEPVRRLAERLEATAREAELQDIQPLMEELVQRIQDLLAELEQLRREDSR
jgi:hypothetical protein